MKKGVLVGLAVVPCLLIGAMFAARTMAWKRTEQNFRDDMIQEALSLRGQKPLDVLVWRSKHLRPEIIGQCSWKEFQENLSEVHLQQHGQTNPERVNPVVCLAYGQEKWSVFGLIFQLDANKGAFSFEEQTPGEKWERFELTPASRRDLIAHLWKSYGPKLRALHVPPPR